jgi:hypothetical protein
MSCDLRAPRTWTSTGVDGERACLAHRQRRCAERLPDELALQDLDEVCGDAAAEMPAAEACENKTMGHFHRVVPRSVSRPLILRHAQNHLRQLTRECGGERGIRTLDRAFDPILP